jgi:hypothetical protein
MTFSGIKIFNSLPSSILNHRNDRKHLRVSYTGIFQKIHFTLQKNFWSSAEIINLVNYFCCVLYCIILLSCCSRYMYLETVVLTSEYLICFVMILCVVFLYVLFVYCFFLTSFMSDCLYNGIFGPTKR